MSCSVHDVAEYEASGIPAVFVASEEFVTAAIAQSTALGTDPAVVYVAHPIQSRNDGEIASLAAAGIDELIGSITES